MKKRYFAPEMEVVKIQMMGMLASSLLLDAGSEIEGSNEILAPELEGLGLDFETLDVNVE